MYKIFQTSYAIINFVNVRVKSEQIPKFAQFIREFRGAERAEFPFREIIKFHPEENFISPRLSLDFPVYHRATCRFILNRFSDNQFVYLVVYVLETFN